MKRSIQSLALYLAQGTLVVGLLGFSSEKAAASAIEISASLSDTVVLASDSLTLTCVVRWDNQLVSLSSESPPTLSLKRLEIGAVSARSESITHEGKIYSQRIYRYTLTPIRSGLGLISAFQIGYVTLPDSIPALAATGQLSVRIVIPDRPGESQSPGVWLWAVLTFTIVSGAVGVWYWRAKGQKSSGVNPDVARLENQLLKLKALTSASRAEFYTEAHGLLLQIESLATAEALSPELEARLAGWIEAAAREKFAPGRGEPGETFRRYVEIESFVRREIFEKSSRSAREATD